MEIISITVDTATINKMKEFYKDFTIENSNENLLFFARLDECVVSAYKSNKIVFQGHGAVDEASIWAELDDNSWKINISHGGSDEVGTGDYFGPICVAAVFVKKEDIEWLSSIGVQDSKKIDDNKIMEIGPKLIKRLTYSQLSIDNNKYNQLTTRGFNMNKIKAYMHNSALLNIQNKVNDKNIQLIVDQFTPQNLYYAYLKDVDNVVKNVTFMTKAESLSPAVAAASVIARYSFLLKMEELGKKYNTNIPKGAGAVADTFGELFIKIHGIENLPNIAKMNFKNTEKIKELMARFKV